MSDPKIDFPQLSFHNIHEGIDCVCVGAKVNNDTTNIFVRRIAKGKPKENDFKSYWEVGKRPKQYTQKNICSYKSVSVYLYEQNIDIIASRLFEHLKKARSFKRKISAWYCMFKLKAGAGHIDKDGKTVPYHCSFFKADAFSLDRVEVIKTEELK